MNISILTLLTYYDNIYLFIYLLLDFKINKYETVTVLSLF